MCEFFNCVLCFVWVILRIGFDVWEVEEGVIEVVLKVL